MPFAVAKWTSTLRPLGASRPSVKAAATVPALPSVTVTSLTETTGSASSSVIVPVADPSAIAVPSGAERVIVNVSSFSSSRSPLTGTVIVFEVSPTAKSSTPLVDVKSAGAAALPLAVA